MRLSGRVAIVTGGGKGIGHAYVHGLAKAGAKIVVADIDETAARSTGEELTKSGYEALVVFVDVASEPSVQAMVQQTLDTWGRVDVLVNNAGLHVDLPSRPFDEVTIEEWDRVLNVNLRSMFLACRAVVPHMRRQGGGSIINISSVSAFVGGTRVHYGASKAGAIGLTRSLARVVGRDNIRVNAVAPGGTESYPEQAAAPRPNSMSPLGVQARSLKRVEVPEDLVGAVVFLASDESGFMTGQTLVVDGGHHFN